MIRVKRSKKDNKKRLIRPPKKWYTLAKNATQRAIADPNNHTIDDSVYGHDQVRAALEELFYNKCAYCETRLPEAAWNVEHFRPKGRIAENKNHPGYYWLAYEWENMYPSCVPCNQKRRDKPIWGDTSTGIVGGKADKFPLSDEKTRATKPGDNIKKEKKLLLDPCQNNPERHLTYGINGDILGLDEYGEATISICFLSRRRLKVQRREQVKDTVESIKFLRDLKVARKKANALKFEQLMKLMF